MNHLIGYAELLLADGVSDDDTQTLKAVRECLVQPDSGIDLVLLDVMMPRLDGFACWSVTVPTPRSDTSPRS